MNRSSPFAVVIFNRERIARPLAARQFSRHGRTHGLLASPDGAFQLKQLFFYVEAATVAAKLVVASDNAMAGNDDGNRIVMIRHAHGAKSTWIADRTRLIPVGARLAVRNREQGIPAAQLKLGSAKIERLREDAKLAGEVGVEFTAPGLKMLVGTNPRFASSASARRLPWKSNSSAQSPRSLAASKS